MDRLISEQEVLDVIASWFESVEQQRILQGRIKAIPSAELYKGMTNGEVVKAVFNTKMIDDRYLWESLKILICGEDDSWWNSPYKGAN